MQLGKVSNWELADGELAHRIEQLNLVGLKSQLLALIVFSLERAGSPKEGPPMPNEGELCLLHHAATVFLLKQPGRYRQSKVHLQRGDVILFQPPHWNEFQRLMGEFFSDLAVLWREGDPLDVAAFALWRISWIHPFRDGNGRTAFAFAYACLCLKLGALLPNTDTVLDQMLANPAQCNGPLRTADESIKAAPDGKPDLSPLKRYYDQLLLRQIRSAGGDPEPRPLMRG